MVEGLKDGVIMLFTEKEKGKLMVVAETSLRVFDAISRVQVIELGTEHAEVAMLNS